MPSDSLAVRDNEDALVLRHYTYYRPTILVLLKEHESHGYELTSRMTELGFDHRLASSIYKVLRDMEGEGLITSSWDVSRHGGPPRRMYGLTRSGGRFLQDSLPTLERQRQALDALLDLYWTVQDQATALASVTPAAVRQTRSSSDDELPDGAAPATNSSGPRKRPRQR